ncbi:MAG TPA: FAD-dependent oxidoreductase [Geobacteraceae bacterium]|nr:FAD-dependent oxidoreductase [Geobacteraceae bacterium]
MIRNPETFRERFRIDVRTGHEVVAIDPAGHRVLARRLADGLERWEPFDQLLIATGAVPYVPDLAGAGARGIFGVNTLQQGVEIRRFIEEERPQRGVIVGGGYIGLEMAEALIRQGLGVTLVDRQPQVMGTLDPDMGALVAEALRGIGVTIHLGEPLVGFETTGGRVTGVVTGERTLPADLVVLGMGVRPNSRLAREAGIPLGEKESIRVNGRMETEVAGVWAAGDCAESFHLVSRRPFYVALGTVANKHGRVAGINISGGNALFGGVVGTAITKVCDLEVARSGLHEKELAGLGIDYATARIESRTHAGYYPGVGPITVKLLAEKGSGRLLGGQIVGTQGAGKRIDIVAVSLHAGLTVAQVSDLDLAYAPPFSPVWDPVAIAARETTKLV